MATCLNIDHTLFIDGRAYKPVSFRNQGKGRKHIQFCYGLGRLLDPFHFPCNSVPDLHKQIVFQGKELILRIQNHILQLF